MDLLIFRKLIFSIIAILSIILIFHFLKRQAREIAQKKNIKKTRYFVIKRLIFFVSLIFLLIILIFIWGINIKDLWVSIAGILAMVAVAFFAVWSLVGNILAGVIIYFTTPFKINDTIEIMPDGIKGKVLAINTFYSLIIDEEENYINIPNSLFFQKYIRNIRKK
ncbi:MAG: mechanosensitive ion channel [Candidatus Omnitrophica bacterium]|nr:mechanosensitive ion channel [Candidatus Omnitrophota bacterium]